MSDVFLDNDVLLKGMLFGILEGLVSTITTQRSCSVMALGVARYVVHTAIGRANPQRGVGVVQTEFNHTLSGSINVVEPTPDEEMLAGEFEYHANILGVPFDTGESLLAAILVSRRGCLLLTGDKRAICAGDTLLRSIESAKPLEGKLGCLEQLMLTYLENASFEDIRLSICAEAGADRAISSCFSCYSDSATRESCLEGLTSYVEHLRGLAPRALVVEI